jgi:hypothetical protein
VTCLIIAQRARVEMTGRQSENVRAKLERLEDRGWLRRSTTGTLPSRPDLAGCGSPPAGMPPAGHQALVRAT